MKKLLSILVILLVVFSFISCNFFSGSGDKTPDGNTDFDPNLPITDTQFF
jgi:hypothetical protein